MKYIILTLLLTGCTLHVETTPAKTEKEVQQDNIVNSNRELLSFCRDRCLSLSCRLYYAGGTTLYL